ncbi:DUF6879 family protein [Streptomyces botrytidirepellens]|uniref:DUF6879 domain-containing protein n=1 Tax=Streptomyces botrytidirepellens TaxID=2486417 RepID=A0A3M8WEI4_9ACTN|nr:DUF6879 family protein [Streptomyces botrytidirepellens]RNG26985.1 hypothetical protein EEJ42_14020 [Streptomyces botrytidirepellens]
MATAVREALGKAQRSAVHLEMRDIYTPDDPDFADWRAGVRFDPAERWQGWFDLVVATVSRGVRMRRARVVSEPVSEYIKFEYAVTERHNVAAGEEVRWLPRRRAADLALPGADCWLIDEEIVIFNHFDGNGNWDPATGMEARSDPATARMVGPAFESVWQRAVPHSTYRPGGDV